MAKIDNLLQDDAYSLPSDPREKLVRRQKLLEKAAHS